jgi:hypothetical protein
MYQTHFVCFSVSCSMPSSQHLFVKIWHSKITSFTSFQTVVYSICMQRCGSSQKTASIWTGVGQDSVVGIGTCYGWDVLGIKSRWRQDFSAPIQTSSGARKAFYTLGTGSFLGVNRPGRGIDHPPLIYPRDLKKGRVISPLPFRGFMACFRVNFTFMDVVSSQEWEISLLFKILKLFLALKLNIKCLMHKYISCVIKLPVIGGLTTVDFSRVANMQCNGLLLDGTCSHF